MEHIIQLRIEKLPAFAPSFRGRRWRSASQWPKATPKKPRCTLQKKASEEHLYPCLAVDVAPVGGLPIARRHPVRVSLLARARGVNALAGARTVARRHRLGV